MRSRLPLPCLLLVVHLLPACEGVPPVEDALPEEAPSGEIGPSTAGSSEPAPPVNTPIDSSGNGTLDFVVVEGDYNGNGVVSMQDLEDAARALTAPAHERKEIRVVGPHVYGVADVPPPQTRSRTPLLALDSNTVLECDGAVLEGWDETASGPNGHVIVNRDVSGGNQGIRIRGCTIDGGQPDTSFQNSIGFRTVVYFDGCSDCAIERSTLRNSFHACFYARHGEGIFSTDNRYENCGSNRLDRPGDTQGQPCLYVFAESGRETRGVYSTGDVMLGCGAPAFNVRRADATARISDIRFTNALVEDVVLPAHGNPWACFNLRGSESDNLVSDVTCRRTAGLFTGWGGAAAGGYDHEDTTRDAHITDVDFESMEWQMVVGPWSTDVVLSGISIQSSGLGLVVQPPNRGLVLESSTICGALGGILVVPPVGPAAGSEESMTIRDTAVGCPAGGPAAEGAYPGIEIRGGGDQKLTLVDVDIDGVTGDAIRVHDPADTGTSFELSIAGGRFAGSVRAEDDASILVRGGHLERIVAVGRATFTLFGSGFAVEGAGTPAIPGAGDLGPGFEGRITGTLVDGSLLDVSASAGPASMILLRAPTP